ncbi:MAG: hypothetical protein V3U52_09035 [Thermoplasmata archaeon]
MLSSWRGKVFLPMERVVQAIEGALDRLGYTYRKSYDISLGRRVEVFLVTSPLRFTIKAREAGLIFGSGEKRRISSVSISQSDGSLPFLRSFLLELARRLPHPPWKREKEARESARRTWLKVSAISAILVGLGSFYLFFTPPTFLALFTLILNLVGISVALAAILLTHPEVESRIQRWKWGRWMKGPELAALGWTEKHA